MYQPRRRPGAVFLFLWLSFAGLQPVIAVEAWKFGHTLPDDSALGKAAREFADAANRELEGRAHMTVFPNGEIGSATNLMEQVRRGVIDFALIPTSVLARSEPDFDIFALPFLFRDYGAVTKFQASDAGTALLKELESSGLKGFAFWHDSMAAVTAARPITGPSDLKSMKILAGSGPKSKSAIAFERLGANVTPIQFAETYQALANGTVDGSESSIPAIQQRRIYEVNKYVTVTNHAYFGYVLVANPKLWASLAPQERLSLEKAIAKVTPEANASAATRDMDALRALYANAEIKTLSTAQHDLWQRSVRSTWEDFADTSSRKKLVQTALNAGLYADPPTSVLVSPTWTSWIAEDNDAFESLPLAMPLQLRKPFRLRFVLSLVNLSVFAPEVVGGSAVSSEASQVIESIRADSAKFTVIVLPSSEAGLHIAQQYRSAALALDLRKYREHVGLNKHLAIPAGASFADVARKALVGYVDIPFDILKEGRHEIGLAVISPEGVPVADYTAVVCAGIMCSGSTARSGPAVLPPGDAVAGDFVLWLHEVKTEDVNHDVQNYVFAILAIRDKGTKRSRFLRWNLWTSLYSLLTTARSVRNIVADSSNSDRIATQGQALGRQIFHPIATNQIQQEGARDAIEARRLLAAAATGAAERPGRIVFRVSSSTPHVAGAAAFHIIPIGLAAFTPDGRNSSVFLGRHFAISNDVPNQFSTHVANCPQDWRISFPARLSTSEKDALQIARAATEEEFKTWPISAQVVHEPEDLSGDKSFKTWLGTPVADADQRTTVFSFLGHHDANSIFFNKDKASFSVAEIQRLFRAPSVAILDACDVAMEDVTPGTLVGTLIRHRMQTVIATTSRISGPLAAAYLRCMRHVVEQKERLSVGDAHYYTTQCLWNDDQSNPWNLQYRFAHSALKYQVFGNPEALLCYPKSDSTGGAQ